MGIFELFGIFIAIAFVLLRLSPAKEKPSPIKKLDDHPWFQDKKKYINPIQEEYVKNLTSSKNTIYVSIKTLFIENNMIEVSKKLDYYSQTNFTKYGNHYNNIYKRYKNKCPKTKEEANIYRENFIIEYEKSIEKLGERLIKEDKEEKDRLLKEIINRNKKFEREKKFIKLSSKVGQELAKYITKFPLSSEEVGLRYEQYIGYLAEKQGFEVVYHGATKGKKDGGIDLIAKKDGKTIIVQCKNIREKNKIHENVVNQLNTVYQKYQLKNPTEQVTPRLITTHDNLDNEAKESVELFKISHVVIPMSYDYPMVKCNINKTKKLYHLPTDAQYSKIKIRVKQGNYYCYSPEEAEKGGFCRSEN